MFTWSQQYLQCRRNYVCLTDSTKNNALDKQYYRGRCWLMLFLGAESDPDSSKHTGGEKGGRDWGGGKGQGGGI